MSAPNQPVLEIHSGIVLKGQLSMAKDVVLTGKFEGDIKTLGVLTVATGGAVLGTIEAGGLVLEPGNLVDARVKVSPPPKDAMKALEEKKKEAGESFWPSSLKKLFTLGRK